MGPFEKESPLPTPRKLLMHEVPAGGCMAL